MATMTTHLGIDVDGAKLGFSVEQPVEPLDGLDALAEFAEEMKNIEEETAKEEGMVFKRD